MGHPDTFNLSPLAPDAETRRAVAMQALRRAMAQPSEGVTHPKVLEGLMRDIGAANLPPRFGRVIKHGAKR